MTEASAPTTAVNELPLLLVVIDDSDESSVALAYACARARATNGRVALLRVIEPDSFMHWASLREMAEQEAIEEANHLLARNAADVVRLSGRDPINFVRLGNRADAILELIQERQDIVVFILAAAVGDNPGPLVSSLARNLINQSRVPITVVPATMTEADIQRQFTPVDDADA